MMYWDLLQFVPVIYMQHLAGKLTSFDVTSCKEGAVLLV